MIYNQDTYDKYKHWKNRIFVLVWINYVAFYLIRVNISVAIPEIMKEYSISKTSIGSILTIFFITYALGKFINGVLGDKFGARKFISIGLIGSAIVNIVFGFNPGNLIFMFILWGINGYFQSMGWPSIIKVIANWFTLEERPRRSGLLGTSYIIGSAAALALAGFIIGILDWRWCFYIPAIIAIAIAISWLIRGRNAPEEAGLPTIELQQDGINKTEINKDYHLGFRFTIKKVLTNKGIWRLALSTFFINFIRVGFIFWTPTYLFEIQKTTISIATFKIMLFPIAGTLGAVFIPWLANKVFRKRSVRLAPIMLLILTSICWFFSNGSRE